MKLSGPTMTGAFDMLVECCRGVFVEQDGMRLRERSKSVDWDLLLMLARRHRVQGLVAASVRVIVEDVPAYIADALSQDAAAIAANGLADAAACNRLHDCFDQAGVRLAFVKGLTLGKLAYGNPFVKAGWDIDLLVAPADVGGAAHLLQGLGYRAIIPHSAAPEAVARWHRRFKESVWQAADGRAHVELHSRLADNSRLIPILTVASRMQQVEVSPGTRLLTLAREELYAYLTVHGSSSNWFRLKWIADLTALVRDEDADGLIALTRAAERLGAGRAPLQALLLCASLFGEPFRAAAERLRPGPIERWLARAALAELTGPDAHLEPTQRRFGTVRMHAVHLMLKGGGYPFLELARKITEQIAPRS